MLSDELSLLDDLGGHSEPYMLVERWNFSNDRAHALRSIEKMRRDGLITITINGRSVEDWMLQAWWRSPYDRATRAALGQVVLELTDKGAE